MVRSGEWQPPQRRWNVSFPLSTSPACGIPKDAAVNKTPDKIAAPAANRISSLSFGERHLGNREAVPLRNEPNLPDAKHASQTLGWNHHGSGRWRASWRWLQKCRGHRRVKRDVPLHLLHHLMDMPVEYGYRAKA